MGIIIENDSEYKPLRENNADNIIREKILIRQMNVKNIVLNKSDKSKGEN